MLTRNFTTTLQTGSGLARVRRLLLSLLTGALGWAASTDAHAFTKADADTAFTAYNDAFYFTQGTNGYFRATTAGGKTWFWERAEQMEMLLDVYESTTNTTCLTMFSNVFNGFITDHGSNWGGNEFNDDIMWMVIACARGYQHMGNPALRDAARANFDMCYERAWSTNLGGGLWWKTANLSKNACVNGPAAIAAHLLYQICDDTNYLAKSERIYQWERATLFNTNNGAVYDSIDLRGELDLRTLTYNQGTFIGAANLLGYTNDAKLAADFTMDVVCHGGLMPRYGETGDGGGFNGICARWVAKFMRQRGGEGTYQAWLQANANVAWDIRRIPDNLSWSRWRQRTPSGALHSWACSSAVVILHAVPPTEAVEADDGKQSIGAKLMRSRTIRPRVPKAQPWPAMSCRKNRATSVPRMISLGAALPRMRRARRWPCSRSTPSTRQISPSGANGQGSFARYGIPS